jgi:hypothetical protein
MRRVGGSQPPTTTEAAWSAWRWASARDRTAWLGIFLALLGIGLLVERFLPGLRLATLIVLALGLAAAAVWLVWRWAWAMVPAFLLIALGVGQLIEDLDLLSGEGWGALFVGAALAVLWATGRRRDGRHGWAFWPAVIFILVGIAQLSDEIARLPGLDLVWPALLVAAGVFVVWRAVRPRVSGVVTRTERADPQS